MIESDNFNENYNADDGVCDDNDGVGDHDDDHDSDNNNSFKSGNNISAARQNFFIPEKAFLAWVEK